MTKFESLLEDLESALMRLDEILREKETDIVRDSAIQRFEIAFELVWKTIKAFVEERHNVVCASPLICFKEAFRLGIIDYDDEFLLKTIKLRNYTVHIYNQKLADEIYRELPQILLSYKKVLKHLKS